jgi:lipoprotein-releasing system permease protein
MRLERFIALRHIRSGHRHGFVSAITVLSGIGVAVGVMAMVVTLAVMDGFEEDLKTKLLGNMAPITIQGKDLDCSRLEDMERSLAELDEIVGLSPYVRTQVLLVAAGRTTGATLKGIDSRTVSAVSRLPTQIQEGNLETLQGNATKSDELPEECRGKPSLLVGRELSRHLGCFLGDTVRVVSPVGVETPFGVLPAQKTFCVTGIFESGLYEYDASFAYASLETVQGFLRLGSGLSGVEVGTNALYRARQTATRIQEILGADVQVEDWMQKNRRLLSALRLEKVTAFGVLALIILVAVLSILSSLAMAVVEKKGEIAILKALGATPGRIQGIFILQGMLVGVAGTLAGVVLGLGACRFLASYALISLPKDIFYELALPIRVRFLDVLSVSIAGLVLSLLATLYPAWKASRVPPAETLRYE